MSVSVTMDECVGERAKSFSALSHKFEINTKWAAGIIAQHVCYSTHAVYIICFICIYKSVA